MNVEMRCYWQYRGMQVGIIKPVFLYGVMHCGDRMFFVQTKNDKKFQYVIID
jgi:hypothetical protein